MVRGEERRGVADMAKTYEVRRKLDGVFAWWTDDAEPGMMHALPHLRLHSPDGFEFGYGGSGPADLARSIVGNLLDTTDPNPVLYQGVKADLIASQQGDGFTLTEAQVRESLERSGYRADQRGAARAELLLFAVLCVVLVAGLFGVLPDDTPAAAQDTSRPAVMDAPEGATTGRVLVAPNPAGTGVVVVLLGEADGADNVVRLDDVGDRIRFDGAVTIEYAGPIELDSIAGRQS